MEEKKLELNIVDIQKIALKIATKNKPLLISSIVILSTIYLMYMIPLLNIFAYVLSMLIIFSISKNIYSKIKNSESIEHVIDSFEYQSTTRLFFSEFRFSLGMFLAIFTIAIPVAMIGAIGSVSMVFGIFTIFMISMFWYIFPLLVGYVATKRGFYDTYTSMFSFFKESLWKFVFKKDYLLNLIYISLVLAVIYIIGIFSQASIILLPLSAFLTLFSSIYMGIIYFYFYQEFYKEDSI
jgi:hypothetical protein